jgi:flavin-dependent dehydrogenase
LKTLLVERKSFPRDKVCGSCISQTAQSLLDQAGLGPQMETLKGLSLTNVKIAMKSCSIRIPLPGVAFIPRSALDETLVKAAMAQGVEFLPEVTALVAPQNATEKTGTRIVELSAAKTGGVPVETSAIVVADGLGHPSLRKCPEFNDSIHSSSRMGLGTTLSTNVSDFDIGGVTMAVSESGYVGFVRFHEDRLHFAASVDPKALRESHHPSALIAGILKASQLPEVPELVDAEWHGTLPLTRQPSRLASGRVFLIGDAAGYVEPFTGEGIAWALMTGMAVPAFVFKALRKPEVNAEHDWQCDYRRLIRHRQEWCRGLAWLLKRPMLSSYALRLMGLLPVLSRFVVNRLNQPLSLIGRDLA